MVDKVDNYGSRMMLKAGIKCKCNGIWRLYCAEVEGSLHCCKVPGSNEENIHIFTWKIPDLATIGHTDLITIDSF